MKLFAVYADVGLVHKPDWLDAFREKYDKPFPFHITLKQTCFIEEGQVDGIKRKLAAFFQNFSVPEHTLRLTFDRIAVDETDGSIMLSASDPDNRLIELQWKLIVTLGDYKYYEPQSETWEKHFHPHLTIARDLSPEQMKVAQSEVRLNDMPEAAIRKVTLVIVNKPDPEEASLTENLTTFQL